MSYHVASSQVMCHIHFSHVMSCITSASVINSPSPVMWHVELSHAMSCTTSKYVILSPVMCHVKLSHAMSCATSKYIISSQVICHAVLCTICHVVYENTSRNGSRSVAICYAPCHPTSRSLSRDDNLFAHFYRECLNGSTYRFKTRLSLRCGLHAC